MDQTALSKEWEQHIANFQVSGLSKSEWCRQHNLSVHKMYYWIDKFHPKKKETTKAVPNKWLSLDVSSPTEEKNNSIKIHFKDAIVEVDSRFNENLLLQVMKALKQL